MPVLKKNFKYIGTKQDLIDNGFEQIDEAMFERGLPFIQTIVYLTDGSIVDYGSGHEDLIDKGLAIEVEEE